MKDRVISAGTGTASGGEELAPAGRHTAADEQVVEAICAHIRSCGVPDESAALLAGVDPAQLREWKVLQPGLATRLGQARAEFRASCLSAIGRAAGKSGEPDRRAQAWLSKHSKAEAGAAEAEAPKKMQFNKILAAHP